MIKEYITLLEGHLVEAHRQATRVIKKQVGRVSVMPRRACISEDPPVLPPLSVTRVPDPIVTIADKDGSCSGRFWRLYPGAVCDGVGASAEGI